jgi:hypothetical protein
MHGLTVPVPRSSTTLPSKSLYMESICMTAGQPVSTLQLLLQVLLLMNGAT